MRCIPAICCVCGAYQQLVVNVINRLILFLESLLYEFHEKRRDSYLSPESVRRSLGTPTYPRFPVLQEDRDHLRELATYGMVVSEPPGFHPCPSPPDFRRSYLEVSSTVDKILFSMRCIPANCCVCGAYQQLVVNVISRLILSLESLLYEFHEQRRDSYLSPESVRRSLGTPTYPRFPVLQEDRDRLRELATYGMVVSEPPEFHPCPSPQTSAVVT